MKYFVLVPDGMADYPLADLGNKTPLEAAKTPNMDFVVGEGILGMVKTVPADVAPASDVANLSILGYDPKIYYTGRGPLEAANLGVTLNEEDVALRCNFVSTEGDILTDYSSGHISTEEAIVLLKVIKENLGTDDIMFYPGTSYRHLLLVKNGKKLGLDNIKYTPPHDIMGEKISKYLPKGENAEVLIDLMQKSRGLLSSHEVNNVRIDLGENPANMIWLWGQGTKPNMPAFREKFGVGGTIISAVDLLKGIGRLIGLETPDVPGATGYYDTDYFAKAKYGLESLEKEDFVYIHVEAPDEAGHNGDLRQKIVAIERFDQLVVGTILDVFKERDDFRMLILPDHATPLAKRTHTNDNVCFVMYGEGVVSNGFSSFSEQEAQKSSLFIKEGSKIMDYLIQRDRLS
ncbi:MAG TPA: cofactor-independent phosphoglycerate mutase [Candidatus Omnitrophica bacterium]|nr:cofactor-independent phosphoglycerate mutase [Candidatus Omnitrophota bacterium]